MQGTNRIGIGYFRCRLNPKKEHVSFTKEGEPEVECGEDCLALAIADALLGAAALGSVGSNFSKNNDPMSILNQTEKKIYFAKYKIVNLDIIFSPVSAFKKSVQQILSDLQRLLFIETEQINIKWSHSRGKDVDWMECHVVCLLGGR
ncbi:MAG TPA: hypothetical protein EYP36_01710 [Calditrichaeota bacterium]|nr:hypothetical protein [Calditrichota bacterium]